MGRCARSCRTRSASFPTRRSSACSPAPPSSFCRPAGKDCRWPSSRRWPTAAPSSRPRLAAFRASSRTAAQGSSSRRVTEVRSVPRSSACWPTPSCAGGWATRPVNGSRSSAPGSAWWARPLPLTKRRSTAGNIRAVSTAVVTGGAGFLGSHLCDYLLGEGHRVICVDNLDTGSLQNIEHVREREFVFLNHNLTEPLVVEEPVDFVFHLASPASPIDYLRLPLHTLKVGSYGTHNMLGPAKFMRACFLPP